MGKSLVCLAVLFAEGGGGGFSDVSLQAIEDGKFAKPHLLGPKEGLDTKFFARPAYRGEEIFLSLLSGIRPIDRSRRKRDREGPP